MKARVASGDLAILAAILAGLGALKLAFNPFPYSDAMFVDGAYYYQVARNVAAGNGLQTNVSVYHQGLSLPHAMTYYPLWPAVLGIAGLVIGLERAAHWLPEALYFMSLGLLYLVANQVARVFGETAHLVWTRPRITAGHLAVLLFGLNRVFFTFTSLPFTEALGFTLALGALLCAFRTVDRPQNVWMAVLTGVLGGACFLVRSQLLLFALVLPASFALLLKNRDDGRAYLRHAVATAIPVVVIVGGWAVYVSRTLHNFTVGTLVDPIAIRELPSLPPYRLTVPTSTIWEFVVDLGRGLWVSWLPFGEFSFARLFGPVAYVVVLAALLLLRPRTVRSAFRQALVPAAYPAVITLLTGVVTLAPVYLIHLKPDAWMFHFRYGLPLIFPIMVALPFLQTQGRLLRTAGLLSLAISTVLAAVLISRPMRSSFPPPNAAAVELAQWVAAQPRTPTLLSTNPWTLSAVTGASVHHWMCEDDAEIIRVYFERLNVDYLLTYPKDHGCVAFPALKSALTPVARFGRADDRPIVLWRLQPN